MADEREKNSHGPCSSMLLQWKPWCNSVSVLDNNKDLFQTRPHGSKLECLVCCRWGWGVCAAEVFSCSLTSRTGKCSCSLHRVQRNKSAHFTPTNSPCSVGAHCVRGSLPLKPSTNSLQVYEIIILNFLQWLNTRKSEYTKRERGHFSADWKPSTVPHWKWLRKDCNILSEHTESKLC